MLLHASCYLCDSLLNVKISKLFSQIYAVFKYAATHQTAGYTAMQCTLICAVLSSSYDPEGTTKCSEHECRRCRGGGESAERAVPSLIGITIVQFRVFLR